MGNFAFSDHDTALEMNKAYDRGIERRRVFLLLLGPSAVGKSVIMDGLRNNGAFNFEQVQTVMTRPNRDGESEKVSVSNDEFDEMEQAGEFLIVNSHYEVRYGTAVSAVLGPLGRSAIPMLDFPLSRIEKLKRPEYETLSVYVYPSSTDEWRNRLESSGRNVNGRFEAGMAELGSLAAMNCAHPSIDLSVVNREGEVHEAVDTIIQVIGSVTR